LLLLSSWDCGFAADRWPGLPAASYFLCLAKESNQRKAPPLIPKPRKSSLPDGRQRTRPAFAGFFNFVSGTQTPLPLIHPSGSIFGGAERGESQNQGGGDWAFAVTILALHIRLNKDCALRELLLTGQQ